jgi:hypothetical protein
MALNYIKHTYRIKRVGETWLHPHWGFLRRQRNPLRNEAPPQRSALRYVTYKQANNTFQYII